MNISRNCLFLFAMLVFSGCRIEVTAPAGGSVASESGAFYCPAMHTCSMEVTDTHFDETFVVQPRTGLIFSGWKKGNKYLCGGKLTACRLVTTGFSGHDGLMAILQSDEDFYLRPTFIEADAIRRYRPGDRVIFSGVLTVEEGFAPAVLVEVQASVDILSGVYSHADKEVLAMRSTITALTNGEQKSVTSHFWQEGNGAFVDINDEYGNFYWDAGASQYGLGSIPAPLVESASRVAQFYTLFAGHTSGPVTSGTRSVEVGREQTLQLPLGSFRVYPVTISDSYKYTFTYADNKRGASVERVRVLWVSQAKGIVKIDTEYTEYTPTGTLQRTTKAQLQAIRTSF